MLCVDPLQTLRITYKIRKSARVPNFESAKLVAEASIDRSRSRLLTEWHDGKRKGCLNWNVVPNSTPSPRSWCYNLVRQLWSHLFFSELFLLSSEYSIFEFVCEGIQVSSLYANAQLNDLYWIGLLLNGCTQNNFIGESLPTSDDGRMHLWIWSWDASSTIFARVVIEGKQI